jgi:hypothetical protein
MNVRTDVNVGIKMNIRTLREVLFIYPIMVAGLLVKSVSTKDSFIKDIYLKDGFIFITDNNETHIVPLSNIRAFYL